MNHFLLSLASLSLGGSAAVILLALAGRFTRTRYAARWRCWLWAALCLRLALPFPLSLQTEHQAPIQLPAAPALIIQNTPSAPEPAPGRQPQPSTSALPHEPDLAPASLQLYPSHILFILWLSGMIGVLLWNLTEHLRLLSYLRRWAAPVSDSGSIRLYNTLGNILALPRRPTLLVCQGLKVPMLAGLIRPRLLLPAEPMSENALRHALLHELVHYRRRDLWLNALLLLVKSLYWFNPLMWWMEKLSIRDTELACDEEVLRLLPPEEHALYGETVLSAAALPR